MRFPFELNADKYLRNLWNKQTYLYLAEFFRTAKFDPNMEAVADQSIDDYRYSGGTAPDISVSDWRLPGAGGATIPGYASYFKVYDASSGGVCKIGVKDGSVVDPLSTQCGFVWANGEVFGVDAYESAAIESAGSIWVWRVDEVGAEGFDTYVETTTSSTPPTGGGFAYRTRLLGRAEIVSDGEGGHVVSDINQDYLKGGDDEVYLWWDCDIPEQGPEA